MTDLGTTMPIELKESAFLLERLAADCAPLQAYRELTKNSLEATERVLLAEGSNTKLDVCWDVEWHLLQAQVESGAPLSYKLCIWDTGDGMTGEEMVRYINHLSSSGGVQALDANFGVGAKITAGVSNPAGLIYTSYKHGRVQQIHFWRDPETKVYGIKPFLHRGEFVHWRNLKKSVLPEPIIEAGHGTMVTLVGRADDENTLLPPYGAPGGLRWLVRYLNRRFFRFPDNVAIKVREFAKSDPTDWPTRPTQHARDGGILRPANGQKHYLDLNAEASGTVVLDEGAATAHWWLLKEQKVGDQSYWLGSGHIAALYQDELYELRDGAPGMRQLMHFGVLFGSKRVVIYVEPSASMHLTPNTARSLLLLQGEPLPWESWAAEFRSKLPEPIRQMMEELLGSSSDDNAEQAIKERLKRIEQLMRITRYRRTPNGETRSAGEAVGGAAREGSVDDSGQRARRSGTDGGRAADLYGAYVDEQEGDPSEPIIPRPAFPEIRWVSLAKGTREQDDPLEDRAAQYVNSTQNVLLVNEDFRVYTDLVVHFTRLYEGYPGVEQTVPAVIKEWYGQQLVEAVLGAIALRGSAKWTPTQDETALSEEALTAVVMPRYHVYNSVARVLGSKLGSVKDRGETSAA